MTRPLRLGILGAANIAHGFADGVAGSEHVQITAVASRRLDTAATFASRHGIPRTHGSYEAMLADRELDAIYIPLPNSLHAPWTARALEAGFHVLCEKPLTLDLAEALPLFALARRRERVLLEAYPYRYQPQTLALKRLLDEGAIGEVRLIQAYFGFSLPADQPNVRLDAALGGGATLDAGCYAVSLARLAAGRRPVSVLAQARWTAADASGVDIALTGSVHYEGGAVAQIACAMDAAVNRQALVIGSAGLIECDYLNHTSPSRPGHLRVRHGVAADAAVQAIDYAQGNGFRFEAEHFARQVALPPAERDTQDARLSLENMATLEALLRSAREGRAVAVAPIALP